MIKPNNLKHKSRRLQKKLHIGEFAETHFEVRANYIDTGETYESFLDSPFNADADAFMDHAEKLGLSALSFHTTDRFSAYLRSCEKYSQVTEEQRQSVLTWLNNNPLIDKDSVVVNDIVDSFY